MIGARGRSFGRWLQRNTPTPIFLALQVAVNAVGLLGLARFTNPISEAITRIVIANEEAHVQSGANFMVMGEEQAGKEKNIKADGRHREQQANVKAKTKGVTQTGDHNNTTATLHETLKTEADKAKDAAEKTLDSTQKAAKAVAEFTHAEENVSKAYTALQEALNALEVVQVTHEVETDHMQAVHSAFLDIIVAEENLKAKLEVREMDHVSALKQSNAKNTANLEASRRQQTSDLHQRDEKLQTKIEMGSTQHKSDLAQEYDKELAKRNHQLEDLLAGQSIEILDKLSRMTTLEVEKQQAKIVALDEDDFEAVEKCQARIDHLQAFLATTEDVKEKRPTETKDDVEEELMDMFDSPDAQETELRARFDKLQSPNPFRVPPSPEEKDLKSSQMISPTLVSNAH